MSGRSVEYRHVPIMAAALFASASAGVSAAPVVDTMAASPVTNVTRDQLENLPTGRSIQDLLKVCPATTIPTVSRQSQTLIDGIPASPAPSLACIQPDDVRMIEVYKVHNDVRAEYGITPLQWNPVLAENAQAHANRLAQIGKLVHASREGRGTERENISQGLPGWSTNQLMDSWLNERRYFTAGIFPNVSTTGDWFQVGHYSQIIWPTTTDIGCGMAQGNGFSWLVCRYNPGGNKDGKPVGQMQTQQIASATPHGPTTPRASLFDLGIYGGGAWSTDWFDIGLGSDSLLIGESQAPFIYSLSTQSLGESCPVPTAPNYLDLALSFRVGDHYSFRLGVNNLLDRDPPTGSFGMGSSSDTWAQVYDSLGRYIFAGCTLDF